MTRHKSGVTMKKTVLPEATGECWCGCGAETGDGVYFRPGHDRIAESEAVKREYGNVVTFLYAHGYPAKLQQHPLKSKRAS